MEVEPPPLGRGDAATWEDGFEETLKKYVPDQADAYMAVLDEWKTNPPE